MHNTRPFARHSRLSHAIHLGLILAAMPLAAYAQDTATDAGATFFAAPASDFVTGQILYVDGGITASQ